MKDEGFSERLNIVLDQQGFPPKHQGRIQQLAHLVGLSHRGAAKWINGESCPPAKKYTDIADKLHVNALWLKTGKGYMHIPADEDQTSSLFRSNLLTHSLQAVPIFTANGFSQTEPVPEKIKHFYLAENNIYFGIVVQSAAMFPRFSEGNILIFETNAYASRKDCRQGGNERELVDWALTQHKMTDDDRPDFNSADNTYAKSIAVKDGDFVFVDHPNYPEPIIRQALLSRSMIYLTAFNPKFEHLILETPKKIIGRAVQLICNFE